jgi:hypothetical protein
MQHWDIKVKDARSITGYRDEIYDKSSADTGQIIIQPPPSVLD